MQISGKKYKIDLFVNVSLGAVALGNAAFGFGNGPILFMNIHCIGNETKLAHCPKRPWESNHSCHHGMDAGVTCPCKSPPKSQVFYMNIL